MPDFKTDRIFTEILWDLRYLWDDDDDDDDDEDDGDDDDGGGGGDDDVDDDDDGGGGDDDDDVADDDSTHDSWLRESNRAPSMSCRISADGRLLWRVTGACHVPGR